MHKLSVFDKRYCKGKLYNTVFVLKALICLGVVWLSVIHQRNKSPVIA